MFGVSVGVSDARLFLTVTTPPTADRVWPMFGVSVAVSDVRLSLTVRNHAAHS